jgi:hypothetical protein
VTSARSTTPKAARDSPREERFLSPRPGALKNGRKRKPGRCVRNDEVWVALYVGPKGPTP